MKTDEYDPKNDLGGNVRFLGSILDKVQASTAHIDTQINMLLGIGSAVFVFSASQLKSENSAIFSIVGLFSSLSVVVGLIAIHPPKFLRTKNKTESINSLLGNKKISSFNSSSEYAEGLRSVLGDQKKITEQYAGAVYNMITNYYRPKRDLYALSRNIFMVGIISSAVIFLYKIIF